MQVNCTHPNGLVLSLGNRNPESGAIDHQRFEVPAGLSDVPDAFWAAWVAENVEWPPYKAGVIVAMPEDGKHPKAVAAPPVQFIPGTQQPAPAASGIPTIEAPSSAPKGQDPAPKAKPES